ncbi:MAG: sugar ABC transporter permease [Eubacteriales bacterium]|nr:sugar ABC transporter permease [Lachnospiraceae bacterium]MDO4809658.1 sugar ABC transporter permease [Eubacteriales bacterium]
MDKSKKAKKPLTKARVIELIQSYLMISYKTIGIIVFVFLPLCWILRFCVYKYKGYGTMKFVGLYQFQRAFQDEVYWQSVKNTFVFATVKLCFEIPIALVTAFLLSKKLRARNFFRALYFLPTLLPTAIIGVIFTYLFAHQGGAINELLKAVGMQPVEWFRYGNTAMAMLIIASVWCNFGTNMLFFMTGIGNIDPTLYEAATVDGATNAKQFFSITIPLLGPVMQMVLMNAFLGSLKVTELVLTLTSGRPNHETEVMMTQIYSKFFSSTGAKDYGYAAALTVITAVILGFFTIIYLKTTKKSAAVLD